MGGGTGTEPEHDEEEDEEEEDEEEDEEESQGETPHVDYKLQYKKLKRKLKYLIYENECYQENLRSSRSKLLEIARDRSFLLDRLLQYEKVEISSSSDSGEETESSDGETEVPRQDNAKRKKLDPSSTSHHSSLNAQTAPPKHTPVAKKKRPAVKTARHNNVAPLQVAQGVAPVSASASLASDGHMTPEEVERHLSSRGQSFLELVPERAPPTVPTEMFSNEPSLDSESNEIGDLETSPSNIGEDCLSVDMMAE